MLRPTRLLALGGLVFLLSRYARLRPQQFLDIGLVFAVLTERVRWAVAFKTAVFMPMAISLFAAGVIWRIMDQQEPNRGALNAVSPHNFTVSV